MFFPPLVPIALVPSFTMPHQPAVHSTSRHVKMTVIRQNGPRTTMASLLHIRQDRLNAEQELNIVAQCVHFFKCSSRVPLIFTSTEWCAAVLSAEAVLEVGTRPSFHDDTEISTISHPDHSELIHDDNGRYSDDNQLAPVPSRILTNVYSAYARLQLWTKCIPLISTVTYITNSSS